MTLNSDPPASTSWVLGFQLRTTTPGLCFAGIRGSFPALLSLACCTAHCLIHGSVRSYLCPFSHKHIVCINWSWVASISCYHCDKVISTLKQNRFFIFQFCRSEAWPVTHRTVIKVRIWIPFVWILHETVQKQGYPRCCVGKHDVCHLRT